MLESVLIPTLDESKTNPKTNVIINFLMFLQTNNNT
jgi:hypothetical protein